MLGAILAAASVIESGVKAVGSIADGLGKINKNDAKRVAAAQSALDKALAGDSSQLTYMLAQRYHSATSTGKEAFRRALATYDSRFGTSYANAPDPLSGAVSTPSPAQSVVDQTAANIKRDVAAGVQQLATGAVNKTTAAISPNAGTSIPLTQNQLYVVGALGVVGGFLLLRKHHS